jgi:hypothetical protein
MTALLGAVAMAYGMGAAVSSLLQARRMRERGTSADVSLGFLGSYLGGYAIWLAYGLSIGSVPLIAVDALGLVCGGLTLLVAVRLRPAQGSAGAAGSGWLLQRDVDEQDGVIQRQAAVQPGSWGRGRRTRRGLCTPSSRSHRCSHPAARPPSPTPDSPAASSASSWSVWDTSTSMSVCLARPLSRTFATRRSPRRRRSAIRHQIDTF